MKFESSTSRKEVVALSEDTETQLADLGLSVEQFNGKVLDVGAGEASLAKELKERTGADIVSVDRVTYDTEHTPDNFVQADVRRLPFEENSFDRVISHASIPNIFIGMYEEERPESSKEAMKQAILESFREVVRVLKVGADAVFAPVRVAHNYDSEKAAAAALEESLSEIKNEGVSVSFVAMREVENPENKETYLEYRLTLSKK